LLIYKKEKFLAWSRAGFPALSTNVLPLNSHENKIREKPQKDNNKLDLAE
jgi:hypothetical protein